MPISKTCYFCLYFNPHMIYPFTNCRRFNRIIDTNGSPCTEFTPNADWLYIERLEKENEELKKQLEILRDAIEQGLYGHKDCPKNKIEKLPEDEAKE